MATVIGIGNQKGGVGKTTLAINLAGGIARQRQRVLLVDTDRQGSALDWQAIRERDALFTVVGLPRETLHKEIKSLSEGYDYVVIDSPPHSAAILRSVLVASEIFLIPISPSAVDIWASKEVVQLIREVQVFNEELRPLFVVNRRIGNSVIGKDISEAVAQFGLPVAQSTLSQLVVFAESMSQGLLVSEADPKSKANKELDHFTLEVMRHG